MGLEPSYDWDQRAIELWDKTDRDKTTQLTELVSWRPISPDLLYSATRHRLAAVRAAAIRNPHFHQIEWALPLIYDKSVQVRREVALLDGLPPEVKLHLLNDPDKEVRARIMRDIVPDEDLSVYLLTNSMVEIRRFAYNPLLPEPYWSRIVEDRSANLRATVALDPYCPPGVVIQLLRDKDAAVRAAAATSPKVPEHIRRLASLAN